jgi:hypothetical protein
VAPVDNREAMAHRETDLEQITTLLGRCLGRIDEQAFRIQREESDDDEDVADVLEQEAAQLQELVGTLIEANDQLEHADLNRVVEHAVRGCVAEAGVPVVTRLRLCPGLPPVACRPGQLAYATQRAVMLGLQHLPPGGEVIATTRRDGDLAIFELECEGSSPTSHRNLDERATSLTEFVASFDGNCRVATDDRGNLLFAFELPLTLAVEGS